MNVLNLPDWAILGTEQTPEAYRITAAYRVGAVACRHCLRFGVLHRFGTRDQLFLDLPMHGRRVGVVARRQRYRCTACGRTMLQALPDMDENRLMTRRLVDHIARESLRRTFVSIADEVGVDEKTVRNVFRDHAARLDAATTFLTPEWLGIDELTLLRRPRCVFTNLQERTIIGLLPGRKQDMVARRLMEMPRRQRVQVVCIDMWTPYRDAARAVLPQARLIVDKFHVVRMANQGVDTLRKQLRPELSERERRALKHDRFALLRRRADLTEKDQLVLAVWSQHLPLLAAAYELKEAFYGVYDAPDRQEAEARHDAWRAAIPADLEETFRPLTTATTNWREEIFAYFDLLPDATATNATTEALNGLAKLAVRNGRGYSFAAIRAKLLYGVGHHEYLRGSYRSAADASVVDPGAIMERPEVDEPWILDIGANLSTLIREWPDEAWTFPSTRQSG